VSLVPNHRPSTINSQPSTIWTIGHSNRALNDFLSLLAAERIEAIADVRRFPGSRRHPQFGEALSAALRDAGIAYFHFPSLGGRRSSRTISPQNAGWRVPAFAVYADYMSTEEFEHAAEQLASIAAQSRTAVMCAEALPWRCHRRLIADHFIARGWTVRDIIGPSAVRDHALPPFAKISDQRVVYPGPDA
jgi:uncharacterized protein (DUF488 family)